MLLEGSSMKVVIKFGDNLKEILNQDTIVISSVLGADFVIPELGDNVFKMVYAEKYNNYVLMNVSQNKEFLCNGKAFSKILISQPFNITGTGLSRPIAIEVVICDEDFNASSNQESNMQNNNFRPSTQAVNVGAQGNDVFVCST